VILLITLCKYDLIFNFKGIFGMDVGGTLTKIVYFEANIAKRAASDIPKQEPSDRTEEVPGLPPLPKRAASLTNLSQPDHQEALEELYNIMDSTRQQTSIPTRDDGLSFFSQILGGRLHFLHFETRNMVLAINVLSSSGVTENIRTIGCTGGGAHKYAKQFEEQLGITFHPFDELGSLIRGMNFVLMNVVGECYSYRRSPDLCTQPNSNSASLNSSGNPSTSTSTTTLPSAAAATASATATNTKLAGAAKATNKSDEKVGSFSLDSSPQRKTERGAARGGGPPSSAASAAPIPALHNPDASSNSRRNSAPGHGSSSASGSGAGAGAGTGGPDSNTSGTSDPSSPRPRDAKDYTHRVTMPHEMFSKRNFFPYLVVNIGSGVSIVKGRRKPSSSCRPQTF
jgi:hypothetical protein